MFFFILSLLLNLVFNIIKIVDIVIVFIYKQYCMAVIIIMLMVIQLRHCVVINIFTDMKIIICFILIKSKSYILYINNCQNVYILNRFDERNPRVSIAIHEK